MALYGIITRGKSAWVFTNPGSPLEDQNLVKLLNRVGEKGSEVVGVGNFLDEPGDEIILRK
jgi:hypothetical protein